MSVETKMKEKEFLRKKWLCHPNRRKKNLSKKKINAYIWAGATLLAVLLVFLLVTPLLVELDPTTVHPSQRLSPIGTPGHILGTDHLGRDMLSRIVYGGRTTLISGVATALIAAVCGTAYGMFSAMSSKTVDIIAMRLIDLLQSFPSILLAILVVAFAGPGLRNAMLAVALVNIPFFAVLTRSITLSTKEKNFVKASYAIGNSKFYTAVHHVLPNISSYTISQSMMEVGWMMVMMTSLSFLGLGVQAPDPELGNILSELRTVMTKAPALCMEPGIVIIVAVAGFNLLGEGLSAYFDPRNES